MNVPRQIIFLVLLVPVFVWADAYSDKVITDKPVLYWRFSETSGSNVKPTAGNLAGEIVGRVKLNVSGPCARIFPDFDRSDSGRSLSGGAGDRPVPITDRGKPVRELFD